MVRTDDIRALVTPVLAEAGLECWDVEADREVLRVSVDRPGGVDIDVLAEASRAVSALLDRHEEVAPAGHYELEVSSPGLERSLRRREHFERYIATVVAVKTTTEIAGSRRHRGMLVEAGDASVAIAAEGSGQARVEIPYADIDRAHTVLTWGPAPRPASHARSKRRAQAGKLAAAAPNAKDVAR